MRQRRRAERGSFAQARDLSQQPVSRRDIEKKQRQLLLIGAVAIALIVIGLLGYGWFDSSFQPPRKTVGTVSGSPIKLADLVPYTALDSFGTNGSLRPDSALNNRVRDIVIARTAGTIGVDVTDQDLTQNLIDRFEGPVDASETLDALTETGRVALDLFLTTFSVAEADYRKWLRGRIYLGKLQTHFIETAPETAEQVFIEWIITTSSVTAQEAIDRHDAGEAFADLADELTGPTRFSGEGGVVGWVPQGAFTELDPFLFGAEIALNVPIGPLTTSSGSMVVRVTDGPAEQPIEESMRSLLGGTNLQVWLDAQVVDAVVENLGLTVDDSNWVIDQII